MNGDIGLVAFSTFPSLNSESSWEVPSERTTRTNSISVANPDHEGLRSDQVRTRGDRARGPGRRAELHQRGAGVPARRAQRQFGSDRHRVDRTCAVVEADCSADWRRRRVDRMWVEVWMQTDVAEQAVQQRVQGRFR